MSYKQQNKKKHSVSIRKRKENEGAIRTKAKIIDNDSMVVNHRSQHQMVMI